MGKLLPMLVLAAHLGLSGSAAEHEEHPGGRKLPPSLEAHRQEPSANLRAVPRRRLSSPSEPFKVCRKVIPPIEQDKGGGVPAVQTGRESLTKQTWSIPDTVQRAQRHIEGRHVVESEQCTRTHLEGLTQPSLSASY